MRPSVVVLTVLLASGSARSALADPVAAPPTTDAPADRVAPTSSPSRNDETSDSTEPPGLNQTRIAILHRERDDVHRGGPIALLVVGGTVGVFSLAFAQMQGLSGMSDSPSQPPASSPTGLYVASGVGFTAALVGLFWLFDCNQRRGEIQDRIERLNGHPSSAGMLVLPAFNPVSKSAEVTLSQHF